MFSRQAVSAEGDASRGLAVDVSPRPCSNEAVFSDDCVSESDIANPGSDRGTRGRLLRRSCLCVEESRRCGVHIAPSETKRSETKTKILEFQ